MNKKKGQLPTKLCPICNKPFEWRKKWVKNWESVLYCSERCQREAKRQRAKSALNPNRVQGFAY